MDKLIEVVVMLIFAVALCSVVTYFVSRKESGDEARKTARIIYVEISEMLPSYYGLCGLVEKKTIIRADIFLKYSYLYTCKILRTGTIKELNDD